MKKKTIILLSLAMLMTFFSGQAYGSVHGFFSGYPVVRMLVDGKEIRGNVPGVILEGRTMVPVRFVAEALGAKVDWDANSYTVKITNQMDLEDLSISPNISELDQGQAIQLVAKSTPKNASTGPLIWNSSNTDVATVSETGFVSALSPGTSAITVSAANGVSASLAITVKEAVPVSSVVLTPTEISLRQGESSSIDAIISPANASNSTLEWRTLDSTVAVVSQEGIVKAIGPGVTKIIATSKDGNKMATCNVTVRTSMLEIGDSATYAEWAYKVNKVELHSNLSGGFSQNIAKGKYVVAIVEFKNHALYEREVGTNWVAVDAQGRKYSMDSGASLGHHLAFRTDSWHHEDIGPSFSAEIAIAFDVPLDATNIVLYPAASYKGSPAEGSQGIFLLEKVR